MTTPSPLAGKVSLVTGAGVRVGASIALGLGEQGMHVAVHYRAHRAEAEAVASSIRRAGGEATLFQADLAERDEARRLVDGVVSRLGGIDLLVPSAALFERVPFDCIDDTAWDRMLALNLTSNFVLAHQARHTLRERGGSIVFVTCSSVTAPYPNHLPYVVSKAALHQVMRTMALEMAPEVRVNAVAPGTVLPPAGLPLNVVGNLAQSAPLARIGAPSDIAQAVVYLASSPFVTGQELVVDGGRSLARMCPDG